MRKYYIKYQGIIDVRYLSSIYLSIATPSMHIVNSISDLPCTFDSECGFKYVLWAQHLAHSVDGVKKWSLCNVIAGIPFLVVSC